MAALCMCVYVWHMHMYANGWHQEISTIMFHALLFPYSLRQALSLDLGLSWQPESPSEQPPVSNPNSAGVTGLRDQTDFFMRVLGFELRPLCLCRQQSYLLIHACPPPEQHVRFKASFMIQTMAVGGPTEVPEGGTPRESGEVPCTHHGFDAIHPFKGSRPEQLVLSCWHCFGRFYKLWGKRLTRRNRRLGGVGFECRIWPF